MTRSNLLRTVGLALLVTTAVIVPFYIGGYYVDVIIILLINIIIVVSLRLIFTMGEFNFAHIPIMGLGAYTSALITTQLGWSFWLTLPLGGLASALVGLMFSYPLSKTKGFAFFIASFAIGETMRLSWKRMKVPFGGYQGIRNIPAPESILGVDFSQAIPYYFLALVVVVLCLLIIHRVERSRIGDTFKAIASDEDLSSSIGINTTGYKMLAFTIGSFFAGIAGVLFAHRCHSVDPSSFGFLYSLYMLVWVIFGGLHTFAGPILGVTTLTVIHELLRPLLAWVPLFYGVILILTLLFLPEGLKSLPKRWSLLIKKVRGGTQE